MSVLVIGYATIVCKNKCFLFVVFLFFFFKQKTAYEIVSRDWSSDVCSSDLQADIDQLLVTLCQQGKQVVRLKSGDPFIFGRTTSEIQALKAADRKSVV